MSEHQTDWDKYPSEPAAVEQKRVSLPSGDDLAFSMYVRLELIWSATDLRRKADKKLSIAPRWYKKNHGSHVRFAPIFWVED